MSVPQLLPLSCPPNYLSSICWTLHCQESAGAWPHSSTALFISRNGPTYLLSLKRPSCFTLGTRQETLFECVSFLQDAECETFNQVFRGKATSGSSYPDVINHCGRRLPDCCPGDEYRTRRSIWARPSGQTSWKTFNYCAVVFPPRDIGTASFTSPRAVRPDDSEPRL